MSEEVLSDIERSRILEMVSEPQVKPDEKSTSIPVDLSKATFGQLMEMTVKARQDIDMNEDQVEEGVREAVIAKSKMTLIRQILERR